MGLKFTDLGDNTSSPQCFHFYDKITNFLSSVSDDSLSHFFFFYILMGVFSFLFDCFLLKEIPKQSPASHKNDDDLSWISGVTQKETTHDKSNN